MDVYIGAWMCIILPTIKKKHFRCLPSAIKAAHGQNVQFDHHCNMLSNFRS